MKTVILTLAASIVMIGVSAAASITNKDGQSHILIVTEGSDKVEVVVEAGATAVLCPAGCFVTMPSGDRETLSGAETIDIVNGAAIIK